MRLETRAPRPERQLLEIAPPRRIVFLFGRADHEDAPTLVVPVVRAVDLERDAGADGRVQLGPGIGTEDDCPAFECIVDREDERAAVDDHRDATKVMSGKEPQTFTDVELCESGRRRHDVSVAPRSIVSQGRKSPFERHVDECHRPTEFGPFTQPSATATINA